VLASLPLKTPTIPCYFLRSLRSRSQSSLPLLPQCGLGRASNFRWPYLPRLPMMKTFLKRGSACPDNFPCAEPRRSFSCVVPLGTGECFFRAVCALGPPRCFPHTEERSEKKRRARAPIQQPAVRPDERRAFFVAPALKGSNHEAPLEVVFGGPITKAGLYGAPVESESSIPSPRRAHRPHACCPSRIVISLSLSAAPPRRYVFFSTPSE